jgi:hypothetical protein
MGVGVRYVELGSWLRRGRLRAALPVEQRRAGARLNDASDSLINGGFRRSAG